MQRAEAHIEAGEYRGAILELKNVLRADGDNQDARRLLARASYQVGDLETAEVEYERLLATVGDDEEAWLGLGNVLLQQGRATDAFERVFPQLETRPDSAAARVLAADILATLGNLDDAEADYRKVLALDGRNVPALVGLATVFATKRDYDAANESLRAAMEADPGSAMPYRMQGNIERMRQNYKVAADAYLRAIERENLRTTDNERFMTRVNRAASLLDARDFDAAERQIGDLSSEFGGHPLLNFLRGRLAFGRGDIELAQRELQTYLAAVPDDPRAQAMMGAVSFSQNYLRQAEMYLQFASRQGVGGDFTRRLLAETQLRLNKPEAALRSLGGAEDGSLSDPEMLHMLGRASLGRGDIAAAVDYFEQGVSADPENAGSRLSLAAGLISAGDYERAIDILEQLPVDGEDDYRREVLLLAALTRSGQTEEARAAAEALVAEHDNDARVFVIAGTLYETLGDTPAARKHLLRALDLEPDSLPAMFGLGQLAREEGDTSQAMDWFGKALDTDPAFGPALSACAQVGTAVGRYDLVRERLAAATAHRPDAADIWVLRSRAALLNEPPEQALEIVTAARERHPDEPLLTHVEGLALLQSGQSEAGLRRLAAAAQAAPEDTRLQLDFARARQATGDTRGALQIVEQLRARQPNDFEALELQASLLARDAKTVAARQRLQEFVAANGESTATRLLAGDIEMLANRPADAVPHYAAAFDADPGPQSVLRLLRAYSLSQPESARILAEHWLEDHPDDAEVRRLYAQMLESNGDEEAARIHYELLVASGTEDPVVLNNLAWRYAEEGRPEAVQLAERANRLAPENGSISDTYGWILYREGRLDDALAELRKAAEQSPDNPEIRYHLAKVLADAGQRSEAREILEQALAAGGPFTSRREAESLADALR